MYTARWRVDGTHPGNLSNVIALTREGSKSTNLKAQTNRSNKHFAPSKGIIPDDQH
jgi:hypothetical protein